MADLELQSVYNALQQMYDEAASMPTVRSNSPRPSSPPPHARASQPGQVLAPIPTMQPTIDDLDLREIEYLDPDPHLSCPICHIPFIDPVFADCGHYFCAECLTRYWKTASTLRERKPCPACRSLVKNSQCAPRLIVNMCNDLKVKCPVTGCSETVNRGALEAHLVAYCPERYLRCPDPDCPQKVKRKQLLEGQCRHGTHVECDCGSLVIRDLLTMHNDLYCSTRKVTCLYCLNPKDSAEHDTNLCEMKQGCTGKDLGCDVLLEPHVLDQHVHECPRAQMAPYLRSLIAKSLAPLQEELLRLEQRQKGLEEGIDRLVVSLDPKTEKPKKSFEDESALDLATRAVAGSSYFSGSDHISPTPSSANTAWSATKPAAHRHLLALHENLRQAVTALGQNVDHLTRNIEEVDARNTMLTMNETLRLKEELTLTNNGLYSTRTQLQWLLNRERAGQQSAVRGRASGPSVAHSPMPVSPDSTTAAHRADSSASPAPVGSALTPVRRTSRGSQERVKL